MQMVMLGPTVAELDIWQWQDDEWLLRRRLERSSGQSSANLDSDCHNSLSSLSDGAADYFCDTWCDVAQNYVFRTVFA